jgi:membrane-bound lytic murein transglycosylase D
LRGRRPAWAAIFVFGHDEEKEGEARVIKITRAAIVVAAMSASACVRPSSSGLAPGPATTANVPNATTNTPAPANTPAPPPIAQQATPLLSPPATTKRADTVQIQPSEISKRATGVFGDTARSAAATLDSAPSWDIDVESYASTARVEHYVRLFTGSAKERIQSRLARGTAYEPMIRAKMREGGIPEDMYYLALIESGFDPNAYSRAAAVGMWQFMTSTGRDMGLRIDWWIDERRDPFKSTTAAVRFIKGLNEQFGSLYLAAAAYNGGPGRVSRGLSRYADDLEGTSGDDLFFALADKDYFKNETREYVPQLIAAALIAKDPDRYGMEFETLPPVTHDSVRVGPATPMSAIAHAAGVSTSDILDLNPQVLRGITPPKDSMFVRVPAGKADSFAVAFAALPKSEKLGLWTVVTKKGESFASIAKREGLNARQIGLYNPKIKLLKRGNLAPGQTVFVPSADVARAAANVPDPAVERYGSTVRGVSAHVVKSGETLSGIAKKYHTTTAALMRANGLKRPLIFPGQSLVVSGKASKAAPVAIAKAAKSKSKTKVALATASSAKKSAAASKAKAASVKKVPAKKPATKAAKSRTKPAAKKPVGKKAN